MRYLEGTPIRKLASQIKSTRSTVSDRLLSALKRVPNSNHISEISCKHFKKECLLVDGKYLSVKGYQSKIAFIWCLDEYSHDALQHLLAPSENYQAYYALFKRLRNMEYPLKVLVCDEHPSIIQAAKAVYPKAQIQLCLKHYVEGIRKRLGVRSTDKHNTFMKDVEGLFFDTPTRHQFKYRSYRMYLRYSKEEAYRQILLDINYKINLLTTHYAYACPKTTNLIEAFNSHLEARVKSMRGFESYLHAEKWLNAYVINRRLTRFSECNPKYSYLNGYASIQFTADNESRGLSLLKDVS